MARSNPTLCTAGPSLSLMQLWTSAAQAWPKSPKIGLGGAKPVPTSTDISCVRPTVVPLTLAAEVGSAFGPLPLRVASITTERRGAAAGSEQERPRSECALGGLRRACRASHRSAAADLRMSPRTRQVWERLGPHRPAQSHIWRSSRRHRSKSLQIWSESAVIGHVRPPLPPQRSKSGQTCPAQIEVPQFRSIWVRF